MTKISIDKERCKGCGLCIIYCPKGCIELDKSLNKKGIYPAVFLGNGKCTGCLFCGLVCPDLCIQVNK